MVLSQCETSSICIILQDTEQNDYLNVVILGFVRIEKSLIY
jgi:hypothetical protein